MEDSPSPLASSNYSMWLCSTNQCQVRISPRPIIIQGSALKDLHPCNPPFFSLTLTLLHPISTIWLSNSFQISSGLHSTTRIGSQGGKTPLILTLRCSFKCLSSSAFKSSTGVRAPKK
ncbi:hypothetical protein AMECASPLE_009476 [Ameca splendens]|uniref:Uncharacterized protein n=1 Tax=Ameca splendens TaxID=208324 RepID=A0ABV0YBG6_9TELE